MSLRKRARPRRKVHPMQVGEPAPAPEPTPSYDVGWRDRALAADGFQCQAQLGDRLLPGISDEKRAELLGLIRSIPHRRRLVVHHIEPGGMGRSRDNRPENLLTLCDEHHVWVHAHPREGKLLGLLRGSGS